MNGSLRTMSPHHVTVAAEPIRAARGMAVARETAIAGTAAGGRRGVVLSCFCTDLRGPCYIHCCAIGFGCKPGVG